MERKKYFFNRSYQKIGIHAFSFKAKWEKKLFVSVASYSQVQIFRWWVINHERIYWVSQVLNITVVTLCTSYPPLGTYTFQSVTETSNQHFVEYGRVKCETYLNRGYAHVRITIIPDALSVTLPRFFSPVRTASANHVIVFYSNRQLGDIISPHTASGDDHDR